ncbi:hypothetical protein QWJ41_21195, partial [Nocardioides sp. SOB44]|nr:hypothetical protein [Nocardioides cremeus]
FFRDCKPLGMALCLVGTGAIPHLITQIAMYEPFQELAVLNHLGRHVGDVLFKFAAFAVFFQSFIVRALGDADFEDRLWMVFILENVYEAFFS